MTTPHIPEESPLYPLVPLKEDGEPADIIILTTDQWEEFRRERRTDRRVRFVQSVLLAVAVAAALLLLREAYYEQRSRRELGVSNQVILHNIEEQTSPEHQAAQAAAVNEIVIRVDCNNRKATEDAINELAAQGLIRPVDITSNCRDGS